MPIQQQDTIGDLTKLIGLVKGPSTSTSSSSNISKEGMQGLINQILGGSQGLATVAQGQKAAGLYGSTTNQMLTNDLITRSSQQLAAAQAGTTTTQKTAAPVSGQNIMQLLLLAGANSLINPSLKKGAKKLGLDQAGNSLADLLFPEASASGTATALNSGSFGNPNILSAIGNFADPLAGQLNTGFEVAGNTPKNFSAVGADLAAGGFTAAESSAILGSLGTAAETLGAGGVGLAGGIGSFAAETGVADALAAFGGFDLAGAAAGAGTAAAVGTGAEIAGTVAAGAEGAGILASIGAAISEAVPFLASLFSDERLKTDVKPVGKTEEGQTIYTYKYKGDPIRTHMGVMAQETLKFHPEAVVKHPSGALMVDYDKILGVD